VDRLVLDDIDDGGLPLGFHGGQGVHMHTVVNVCSASGQDSANGSVLHRFF
jgi:hypothetical protein